MMTVIEKVLVLPVVLAVAGCSKTMADGPQPVNQVPVEFRLGQPSAALKSVDDKSDCLTDKVQIAVYDKSGYMCANGTMTEGSLKLMLPAGKPEFKVAAFVNSATDIRTCSTFSSISGVNSSLLSNASGGKNELEMYGTLTDVAFSSTTPCVVPVERPAAKVEIDAIENRIESKPPFEIKGIYLINVNTQSATNGSVSEKVWYQKRRYVPDESSVVTYTADMFDRTLAYGACYDTKHYFYCYSNPTTTDSSSQTWCDRFTRLVVEAEYNGRICYYPINIVGSDGRLDGGRLYRISKLTITGPGSDDPDVPISRSDAGFSISVQNWGDGFSQTVTY